MSLYDRLNLTRPNHRPLKVPIWERIDLTRPPKLRCQGCRSRIQSHWEFCPSCGITLIEKNSDFRRCIWVDVSGMNTDEEHREAINNILVDAFSKVYGAFRSVKVFLTSDPPEAKEWGNNFTHVYIFADNQLVDYLGVASFKLGMVTDRAIIRI